MPDDAPCTISIDAGFDESGVWVIDARISWRNGPPPIAGDREGGPAGAIPGRDAGASSHGWPRGRIDGDPRRSRARKLEGSARIVSGRRSNAVSGQRQVPRNITREFFERDRARFQPHRPE